MILWGLLRRLVALSPECGERTFHCDHLLRKERRPNPDYDCERVEVWIWECCHCKRLKENWPG